MRTEGTPHALEAGNKVRKPEAVSGMVVPWPHIRNFFAQRESRDASDLASHFGRLKIDNVIQQQKTTDGWIMRIKLEVEVGHNKNFIYGDALTPDRSFFPVPLLH